MPFVRAPGRASPSWGDAQPKVLPSEGPYMPFVRAPGRASPRPPKVLTWFLAGQGVGGNPVRHRPQSLISYQRKWIRLSFFCPPCLHEDAWLASFKGHPIINPAACLYERIRRWPLSAHQRAGRRISAGRRVLRPGRRWLWRVSFQQPGGDHGSACH